MWITPDQHVTATGNTWVRLLKLQPDSVRLSVTSSARIHLGHPSAEDVLLRIRLSAVKEAAADIDVTSVGDHTDHQIATAEPPQPASNWNSIFVTLRVGEAVDVVAAVPLAPPSART